MAKEITEEVLGPMPFDEFLDAFLPQPPGTTLSDDDITDNPFDVVPTTASDGKKESWVKARSSESSAEESQPSLSSCKVEEGMYDDLASAMDASMPNFKTRVSAKHNDPNAREGRNYRPDISTYPKEDVPPEDKPNSMAKVALTAEVKQAKITDSFSDTKLYFVLPNGKLLGQLATVLVEIFNRSIRNWSFTLIIADPLVRLVRCDPAGLIITEGINFRTNPRPLLNFLRRFNQLKPSEYGLDETAKIKPSVVPAPQGAWRLILPLSPAPPATVVSVPTSINGENVNVEIVEPLLFSESLTGRCTRVYKVWDLQAKKYRFMKELWRPVGQHLEPEADIIRELNEKQVANVPTLVAGGDIPESGTRTQDFADAKWVRRGAKCRLDKRVKHRLLEDFIPEFLQDQHDAKTIFTAIGDGFVAHQEAYEKCGILHRDISDNNILVTEGRGRLVDWELSVRVDKDGTRVHKGARQNYRTGTWYFMSRNMLCMHPKAHALRDDLESFFWLTVYCSICKLQFATRDLGVGNKDDISDIISAVFEPANWNRRAQTHTGGSGKTEFFAGRGPLAGLTFPGNGALTAWCQKWIRIFEDDSDDARRAARRQMDHRTPDALLSHAEMRKSFDEALESLDWSTNPTPPTQPPTEPKEPKTNRAHPDRGLKRKSSGNNKSGSKKSKHSSQRSGQAVTNSEGLSPAHASQFSASSSRRSSGSMRASASTSTRPTSGFPSHGSRVKVSQEPRFDPPSSASSPFLHPDSQ